MYTGADSAEALNADRTQLCRLPNLPTIRRAHSMSGSMVCGGYDSEAWYSCFNFQNGTWKTLPFTLQEKRRYHVSWTRSGGNSRLLGGYDYDGSSSTSELVSESGSVTGFPMKYNTMYACSIELEDRVIVTGGYYTRNTVSIYYDDGWHQDLADLNTGRFWHSCSHYISENEQVY